MINVTKDFLSLDNSVRTEYFRNILLKAARNGERVYQKMLLNKNHFQMLYKAYEAP